MEGFDLCFYLEDALGFGGLFGELSEGDVGEFGGVGWFGAGRFVVEEGRVEGVAVVGSQSGL